MLFLFSTRTLTGTVINYDDDDVIVDAAMIYVEAQIMSYVLFFLKPTALLK